MAILIGILILIGVALLVYAQSKAKRESNPDEYQWLFLELIGVGCLVLAAAIAALWGAYRLIFG